jgi:hypothetical protein
MACLRGFRDLRTCDCTFDHGGDAVKPNCVRLGARL